jgi:hypothetical protein
MEKHCGGTGTMFVERWRSTRRDDKLSADDDGTSRT